MASENAPGSKNVNPDLQRAVFPAAGDPGPST